MSAIATPEEVLTVMTDIMRGTFLDETGGSPKIAERCRAAEFLARHYGLLTPENEDPQAERQAAAEAIQRLVGTWSDAGKEASEPSTSELSAG